MRSAAYGILQIRFAISEHPNKSFPNASQAAFAAACISVEGEAYALPRTNKLHKLVRIDPSSTSANRLRYISGKARDAFTIAQAACVACCNTSGSTVGCSRSTSIALLALSRRTAHQSRRTLFDQANVLDHGKRIDRVLLDIALG